MHDFAERGIASHWIYKSSEKVSHLALKEYDWLRDLVEIMEKEKNIEPEKQTQAKEVTEDAVTTDALPSELQPQAAETPVTKIATLKEIEMESLSTAVPCVSIKRESLDFDLKTVLSEKSSFEIFSSKSDVSRMIKNN